MGWLCPWNLFFVSIRTYRYSKEFAFLGGFGSMLATYLFLLILTTAGAYFMGSSIKRFVVGFTILYWVTVAANTAGNFAYLAATPNNLEKFGIGWSLGFGELGFVIALVLGLVILGMTIATKTVGAMGLASTVIFRGICAVVEAYLIYWPVVYIIVRKFFKFTPEWAAPMASGISICGVAAAIALFGFILWVGLGISYLFYHGILPPVVGS